MNTIVTSKEEILKNSRELIREKGWAAVSIRSVASACGVSVGSIYNYYDSKAELISATVESVWCEIFHRPQDEAVFQDVQTCVKWMYERMAYGCEQYPGFFTLHSLGFMQEDKADGKRHMQRFCQRLCQRRFAHAGRTEQQHVALAELGIHRAAEINTLIMIIHCDRQRDLRALLPDDIFIERRFDLLRCRQLLRCFGCSRLRRTPPDSLFPILQDGTAQLHTFVADANAVSAADQLIYLVLPFAAERAYRLLTVLKFRHTIASLILAVSFVSDG